jgi:succinate dehydrogenase hydrophobic anchor subunit
MWQAWILGILGIWIIIEPYIGMSDMGNKWALAITGIIVAILGFWGTMMKKEM